MNEFEINLVETNYCTKGAKIKAIGVGGGGGNMINHMIKEGIKGIDLIVANTDAQALEDSIAPFKIKLGVVATGGRGAGMIPEKGREAALESFEEIRNMLKGADMVFISAGLGGGTGTGAAPIVAQAAKEVGALTVSIVTSPFKFEGKKRTLLAKEGLEELKRESDSIIIIPNEKLLSIVEKNLGLKDSFKMVDNILAQAVSGISNVILAHGENDINLDFADIRTVMNHRGLALMGAGSSSGENAAYNAAKMAIESPLLDNISIDGATGILVHFHIHPDFSLINIAEAMEVIEENADENASVIFGTTTDASFGIDEVKITVIATGFEDKTPIEVSNIVNKKHTPSSLFNNSNENMQNLRSQNKIVVGGYNSEDEDMFIIPTFMRKQLD